MSLHHATAVLSTNLAGGLAGGGKWDLGIFRLYLSGLP